MSEAGNEHSRKTRLGKSSSAVSDRWVPLRRGTDSRIHTWVEGHKDIKGNDSEAEQASGHPRAQSGGGSNTGRPKSLAKEEGERKQEGVAELGC